MKFLPCILIALAPIGSASNISLTHDTPWNLEGSFSMTGNGNVTFGGFNLPNFLPNMPGSSQGQFFEAIRGTSANAPQSDLAFFNWFPTNGYAFSSSTGNTPLNTLQSFPAVGGAFLGRNGVIGHWSIYDIKDTGGPTGTYSGRFAASVPDSGGTLTIASLSIGALGWFRRRCGIHPHAMIETL